MAVAHTHAFCVFFDRRCCLVRNACDRVSRDPGFKCALSARHLVDCANSPFGPCYLAALPKTPERTHALEALSNISKCVCVGVLGCFKKFLICNEKVISCVQLWLYIHMYVCVCMSWVRADNALRKSNSRHTHARTAIFAKCFTLFAAIFFYFSLSLLPYSNSFRFLYSFFCVSFTHFWAFFS